MLRRPLSILALALLAAAAASPFAAAQEHRGAPGASRSVPDAQAWDAAAPAPRTSPASSQRDGFRRYGKRWVPGHWATETRRVWQPGRNVRVWVEPVYALRSDGCGNTVRVLVAPGHWATRNEPGCWVSKRVRVWVPGRWC